MGGDALAGEQEVVSDAQRCRVCCQTQSLMIKWRSSELKRFVSSGQCVEMLRPVPPEYDFVTPSLAQQTRILTQISTLRVTENTFIHLQYAVVP